MCFAYYFRIKLKHLTFVIYFVGRFSIVSKMYNYDNCARIVRITGSAKGIGKAIAWEFAEAGYCIIISDFEDR